MIEAIKQMEDLCLTIREQEPEIQGMLMEFWKEGVLHGIELSKQTLKHNQVNLPPISLDILEKLQEAANVEIPNSVE